MKIKLLSDIHNEFSVFQYEPQGTEHEEILILAGDIGTLKASEIDHTLYHFVDDLAKIFKHVILISGNHEYYGSLMQNVDKMLPTGKYHKNESRKGWADNVHYLQNDTILIDDVVFIGSTLWADFGYDPTVMTTCQFEINDYKKITFFDGVIYRKLRPIDTLKRHQEAVDYIFQSIKESNTTGNKVVVCTHHAPTYKSISPEFANDDVRDAYASDLSEEILDTQPNLWVHGHTHQNQDYMIGDTRVVCNPRGYYNQNKDFNQHLILEI